MYISKLLNNNDLIGTKAERAAFERLQAERIAQEKVSSSFVFVRLSKIDYYYYYVFVRFSIKFLLVSFDRQAAQAAAERVRKICIS